jgi:phage terminase Nu1 subunit (DNA packaging protein)
MRSRLYSLPRLASARALLARAARLRAHRHAVRGDTLGWPESGRDLPRPYTWLRRTARIQTWAVHALWTRLWRRVYALSRRASSREEDARYAERLAARYTALEARAGDPLRAIYDAEEPDLDALGLWTDPFGKRLARGQGADTRVRAFAEAYAARYGHTLDDVAASAEDAREAHHAVWAGAVKRLAPERDTRAALERMRHDLERMMTQPPASLTERQAAELREALAPVAAFVERMLRATRDLDATAAHLTLVRSLLTENTGEGDESQQD